MSMCQSLRQYVFVHRAIMEGAIRILDTVNDELEKGQIIVKPVDPQPAPADDVMDSPMDQTVETPSMPLNLISPTPSTSPPLRPNAFSLGSLSAGEERFRASGVGNKRLASPTELLRTNARGEEHTISKRPSLKRIDKSFDEETSPFRN